jgi:eukaryotic-like serine/threonine-protein kinase
MIDERVFNNRYRLDRKLGEGGMATVYCGTDVVLRRRVAIKVLREQYAADQEFVRRFYQEAESAARLSHPNIVNTYDVGHEDHTYFIVMELVDGPSLAEIISADGKLPEPVAIDYATQIASGLAYAHRVGLLHRDIKPANVLVTKDDVVKLSDFGIARAVSQQTMTLTKPGLVMGSVYYMPPEQALGGELHEASDLYSLGIVLYQMLTGKLPYTGESPVSVALKHVHDPVPALDGKSSGVSPALAAIVNKLLQKQPEHRFASASELATALREARERPRVAAYRIADDADTMVLAARSLPPRRSPLPDRPYTSLREDEEERARRSPWLILALVALMLIATGVGYVLFGHPMPDFAATVTVGDYTTMTDAQAQSAIVGSGLRVRFDRSPSDTVPINHVIRQDPTAGVRVERNALVTLMVSNGKPLVGLYDYRTFTVSDAQRELASQGFVVNIVRKFDSSPKDSVIDTMPKPGTKVAPNSHITLIVSNGLPSVQAPNFIGMSVQDAQTAAARLGIKLDASQQGAFANVPADAIGEQDVPPGATIDRGTVVHATVNTASVAAPPSAAAGAAMVTVPSVTGQSYVKATTTLTGAGFNVGIRYSTQTASQGYIIAQDPAPSTQQPQGSTVYVTLAVPGEVPDTDNLTIDDATKTLAEYGYGVAGRQYTTAGANGHVVGTDPPVGTSLQPGSNVTLVINGTPPQ